MSIHQVLRLQAANGTLVLGHRSAFGHARELLVELPEETVRTVLLGRSHDTSVLAHLRRFWQPWQYDPLRTNVHTRDLIDRVARMTSNGSLLAYVAVHRNVDRDRFLGAAGEVINAVLPQLIETPLPKGAEMATKRVAVSSEIERLAQVLGRMQHHVSPAARNELVTALPKRILVELLASLAAWSDQREDAAGLIFDALLGGTGMVFVDTRTATAARHIYRTLEQVWESHAAMELDEAAWWLASAMVLYEPSTLIARIIRGTKPPPGNVVIPPSGTITNYTPPPEVRKPPERFLTRTPASSSSSPPPPPPPPPSSSTPTSSQSGGGGGGGPPLVQPPSPPPPPVVPPTGGGDPPVGPAAGPAAGPPPWPTAKATAILTELEQIGPLKRPGKNASQATKDKFNELMQRKRELSEQLGEEGAIQSLREKLGRDIPDDDPNLKTFAGRNAVNVMYTDGDTIHVVEAKGGNARLGSRTNADGDRVQQGTPEYLSNIADVMADSPNTDRSDAGRELQRGIMDGKVQYSGVRTNYDSDKPATGPVHKPEPVFNLAV